MARHLRIEFPGAFYHVYSRGNQKQPIFLCDEDRFYFLKVLGDATERLSADLHVFCLMPNHYHFIMGTPRGNLSRIMHHVNTAYSIHLNIKHDRCGHLFQGRFKAILMDANSYARILTMYIHANPVRKKIVARPEEFEWSSAGAYFGVANPPPWLKMGMVRACFGNDLEVLKDEHIRYLGSDLSAIPEISRAEKIGILGGDEFVDRIRRSYLKKILERPDEELREVSRLHDRPELAEIFSQVRSCLGDKNRLLKKATIFLAHRNTDYRLKDIGAFFGIGPIATSVAFRKMKLELSENGTLQDAIKEIERQIFGNSQTAEEKL